MNPQPNDQPKFPVGTIVDERYCTNVVIDRPGDTTHRPRRPNIPKPQLSPEEIAEIEERRARQQPPPEKHDEPPAQP
jgi:hypothetical protein